MTQDELALLEGHRNLWVECLFKYLELTDRAIANARKTYRGSARRTVLEDLNNEADHIDSVLTDLLGPAPRQSISNTEQLAIGDLSEPVLQLAWTDGRLIAWSPGHKTDPEDHPVSYTHLTLPTKA